jgi:hypothetical protein
MTNEYEDSSSTIEKLTLIVFTAAIVIGNVSSKKILLGH